MDSTDNATILTAFATWSIYIPDDFTSALTWESSQDLDLALQQNGATETTNYCGILATYGNAKTEKDAISRCVETLTEFFPDKVFIKGAE